MLVAESDVWITLEKVLEEDPYYVQTRNREMAARPEATDHLNGPIKSDHLWKGFLPAGLPTGSYPIRVEAIDAYGRTWKGERVIRVGE